MRQVTDPETRRRIAEAAQRALDAHQPSHYRIAVDENAISEEDDWYQIVVITPGDRRDREFYEALANAEADLQDRNGHKYLLVPVVTG